jgi:type IV secretion system protein VirB5
VKHLSLPSNIASKARQTALAAALCAGVAFSLPASAQIPTTDLAHISMQVQKMMQDWQNFAQTVQHYQSQMQQYQQQFQATVGSANLGNILNDPQLRNMLPREFGDLYSSIKNTQSYATERAKLGTASTPAGQARLDVLAANSATMIDLFKQSSDRAANVEQLMGQIDLAQDPKAKQDLANRIASEGNAIAANANVLAVLKQRQAQEQEASDRAASLANGRAIMCKELGKCN